MSRLRHLLMTADAAGGVWTYALELARVVTQHRWNVSLAIMGSAPSPAQRSQADQIHGLRIFESNFKLEWMPGCWEDVDAASLWLLELERQLQPDIIHLNGYVHGGLPWQAPVIVAAHSCVLSWWQAVHSSDAPAEWTEYAHRVRRGLQHARLVVAVSESMRRDLEKFYGPLPESVVVSNGVNTEKWTPGRKEDLILACGRLWDEAKNIGTLESAAPRLPWPVYVAGPPRNRDREEAAIQNCKSLGTLSPEELQAWYGRAGIFAHPASYEPFGYAPVEAALSGCALLLGDIPSLREIWGDCALFANGRDSTAVAEQLQTLIDNPELRLTLSQKSRERVLQLTADVMGAAYLNLYERVLQTPALQVKATCG